jgi:hypothetical protein
VNQSLPRNAYCYADIAIVSAWPLEGLPPAKASKSPDINITPLAEPPRDPPNTDWTPKRGGLSLARRRRSGGFLLRFHRLADFVISEDGCLIEVWMSPTTDFATLCHLLLDQVLPRILAQQGRLVLHAAAVQIGSEILGFIGDTGSGKSTLAASLHSVGYTLIADDGLVLSPEEASTSALPTYPSLRLWPDAISNLYAVEPMHVPMAQYSSKRRIIRTEVSAKTAVMLPLRSLYVLEPHGPGGSVSLRQLSPSKACMTIIGNSFQLDESDRVGSANVFALASHVAETVPTFSLTYPRRFESFAEVHGALLRHQLSRPTLQSFREAQSGTYRLRRRTASRLL